MESSRLAVAKRVFQTEIESLQRVANHLNETFEQAVELILNTQGKVIVCGIGKSGLIGKKIVATLSSTGTPAFFLHPSEAFHGDLGIISKEDVIVLISFSGETDEVLKVIPFLKWHKNRIIAITGNPNSTLARNADCCLNLVITQEACPLQLAPTSSTTAMLVLGDALAVALMEARNFMQEDFARFHPGGSLGRKLVTRVKGLMRTDNLPFIKANASFTDLILKMSAGRLGLVIIGDEEKAEGIITDGDLRRGLMRFPDTSTIKIADIFNPNPVIIAENEFISEAENLMIQKKIATVLVGDAEKRVVKGVYQIYNT
ncbi:KpsF/GutQ family sugar-phosphate isomerase [Mucilaginibacter arboris]|uniref:KpsF/GutQ family sugar-phosphate isomerase n=1 Tax=Mucilaginibacter arboris TaxID=2682090 RepID=A0A7K1SWT8_9SPHI|nr:KpsF/GutQ family sugar-phosphate isomerase [Mucilaginibacter arboris]MVN21718.1 KpsF/GutQ family sugar-phosphate isomerase [Mucilaginibacter arboris]